MTGSLTLVTNMFVWLSKRDRLKLIEEFLDIYMHHLTDNRLSSISGNRSEKSGDGEEAESVNKQSHYFTPFFTFSTSIAQSMFRHNISSCMHKLKNCMQHRIRWGQRRRDNVLRTLQVVRDTTDNLGR